ncbi:hypothetical protein MTO96_021971 [Rhipicephalus appendiculatus]
MPLRYTKDPSFIQPTILLARDAGLSTGRTRLYDPEEGGAGLPRRSSSHVVFSADTRELIGRWSDGRRVVDTPSRESFREGGTKQLVDPCVPVRVRRWMEQ